MSDFVINDEQPMRGTLIDTIRVVRDYINRPTPPENILIGTKTETIVTADDAFPNIPKGAKVYGKSTQDGTPTPDAPVPILSVDDLTLYLYGLNIWDEEVEEGLYNGTTGVKVSSTAYLRSKNVIPVIPGNTYYCKRPNGVTLYTYAYDSNMHYISGGVTIPANSTFTVAEGIYYFAFAMQKAQYGNTYANDICFNVSDPIINGEYAPYVGNTIPVSLDNHILRSLPDGTCDELAFTYVEPSEREGWGVFRKTLTQKIGHIVANSDTAPSSQVYGDGIILSFVLDGSMERAIGYCTHLPIGPRSGVVPPTGAVWIGVNNRNVYLVHFLTAAGLADITEFRTWWQTNTIIIDYPLATPITYDLGTIELPMYPAPNLTFFASGGNAQPDVQISYERDITIVIDKLEAAETPVGSLSISPVINHGLEPAIQTQEETEWQSDSI